MVVGDGGVVGVMVKVVEAIVVVGDGGVVGVVVKVVVVMVVEMWLVQNNDSKRKTLSQRVTAR